METLKSIFVIVFTLGIVAFFAAVLYFTIHGIGNGPIAVRVGDGRHSTLYRTDKVLPAGPGCIKFRFADDTMTVCGEYRVYKY